MGGGASVAGGRPAQHGRRGHHPGGMTMMMMPPGSGGGAPSMMMAQGRGAGMTMMLVPAGDRTLAVAFDAPVLVMCPRCGRLMVPPARMFRCVCDQVLTFNAPTPITNVSMLWQQGPTLLPPPAPPGGPAYGRRGTPAAVLNALPAEPWSGTGEPTAEPFNCAVCLDELKTGDMVTTLPCLHRYHKKCIDTWLADHVECPLCKASVTDPHPPPAAFAQAAATGGGGGGGGGDDASAGAATAAASAEAH